ncbi:MAG: putative metal-dependent hydrolase [Chitinophagaceae bacterium]|nr:putative metal-dependent hydrolase [Chitinophagaceae bacterium]
MDLRYPIGKFEPKPYTLDQKRLWLRDLQFLPGLVEQAIENLDEVQLNTPYRDGGWNVKQVVHHIADSHINAYTRFKLGLTEDKPTIRPYEEAEWAKLDDVSKVPINISITLLYTLHTRWHATILSLTDEQWMRSVIHPEHGKEMTLWYLLGMYSWHGLHHVRHITSLRERSGW